MSKKWKKSGARSGERRGVSPPALVAQRDECKPFRIAAPVAIVAESTTGTEKKLATFAGCAYTGQPMKLEGFYNPVIIDLEGFVAASQSIPAICYHDDDRLAGHTTSVKIDATGCNLNGVFSGQQQYVDSVVIPAKNDFPWQMSIGANPTQGIQYLEAGQTAVVNGRTIHGPMNISRKTRLINVSFVPSGADPDTSVTVAAKAKQEKGTAMNWKEVLKALQAELRASGATAKYSDTDVDTMTIEAARAACIERAPEIKADDTDAKALLKAEKRKAEFKAEADAILADLNKRAAAAHVRHAAIEASAKKHAITDIEIGEGDKKKTVSFIAYAIQENWSEDKAELEAIRAERPAAGVGVPGGLGFSIGSPEVGEAVLECAVLEALRSPLFSDSFYTGKHGDRDGMNELTAKHIKADLKDRYPEKVQDDAHKIFKGRIGFHELLATIARDNGYRGSDRMHDGNLGEVQKLCLKADGGSTISVANVTANVMNKQLLEGYFEVEQTWSKIAGRAAPKDFKPTKAINLFGDTEFQDLGVDSELANATLADQAFANQVVTRGRIITIPRTAIINDDLSAFGMVPRIIGRGAGLKLNRVFWTAFLNPGFDEGGSTNFFAATHTLKAGQTGNSNLLTGAGSTLSDAGLNSAQKLYDNQIDPVGNPLQVPAEILLYGPDNEGAAWTILNSNNLIATALGSTSAAASTGSNNRWFNRFTPVKSVYINKSAFTGNSTTAWWLLANPNVIAVIEVAFLNGVEMPVVQQAGPDFQFNILGISTRAYFDMGCNMQNFRGGIKSNGT